VLDLATLAIEENKKGNPLTVNHELIKRKTLKRPREQDSEHRPTKKEKIKRVTGVNARTRSWI